MRGCRKRRARLLRCAWQAWQARARVAADEQATAAAAHSGSLVARAVTGWALRTAQLRNGRAAADRLFRCPAWWWPPCLAVAAAASLHLYQAVQHGLFEHKVLGLCQATAMPCIGKPDALC